MTELVVNVHHFPEQIERFLLNNDNFGITVHVSDERERLLDTGGGILKARQWLDGTDPFIVHNADILTDFDILDMVAAHVKSGADATLLTADRHTSRYLCFDNAGYMHGWLNAKTGQVRPSGFSPAGLSQLAFGGVHVLSPTVFDRLARYSDDEMFSIIPFYADNCRELNIKSYMIPASSHWFDIGKPETLELANKMFEQ